MQITYSRNIYLPEYISMQDLASKHDNMYLLTDGDSKYKFSQVGVALFHQLYNNLDPSLKNDVNAFENNVQDIFLTMLKIARNYINNNVQLVKFIKDNYNFTIMALFDLQDRYVVKYLGDGYIITENVLNKLSFIDLNYTKSPPYYVHNYITNNNYVFKEMSFSKNLYSTVYIATRGIKTFANIFTNMEHKNKIKIFDNYLLNKNNDDEKVYTNKLQFFISANKQLVDDDLTIVGFKCIDEVAS